MIEPHRNRTRRSASIPRKLLRERALHLLPVYYLMILSDLGREAVHHSGSHHFADHIYVGTPSGRTALGRWIDARLLALPAARAFRRRCEEAQRVMRRALESHSDEDTSVRVLAVPCGIPRDLLNLASTLQHSEPSLLRGLDYHGMDIDPDVIAEARAVVSASAIPHAHFHRGDALSPKDYPPGPFDVVVSTGLGEFLRHDEIAAFYSHIHKVLRPGGVFFTSATAKDPPSELLLQMVELVTQYRSADDVKRLLERLPWGEVRLTRERNGLQTFVVATK